MYIFSWCTHLVSGEKGDWDTTLAQVPDRHVSILPPGDQDVALNRETMNNPLE